MSALIEKILQDIHKQGKSYQTDFFSEKELNNISKIFDDDFVAAQIGKGSLRRRDESIRGDLTKWLDPKNPPQELKSTFEFLDELLIKLNRELFLGLKEYEAHLAKYPKGAFYKKHIDRFEKDSSRVFTYIFYLHEKWTEEDGGELVLYNKEGSILEKILPLPGSLMCFISEDFPHEVLVSHNERRSLTGWMHTKIIS
jgi:SM-20-related protein